MNNKNTQNDSYFSTFNTLGVSSHTISMPALYLDSATIMDKDTSVERVDLSKFDPDNIEKVVFNPPATIIIFKDGSKQVVKCMDDDVYCFDPEVGFAMAMARLMFNNNRGEFKRFIKQFHKI